MRLEDVQERAEGGVFRGPHVCLRVARPERVGDGVELEAPRQQLVQHFLHDHNSVDIVELDFFVLRVQHFFEYLLDLVAQVLQLAVPLGLLQLAVVPRARLRGVQRVESVVEDLLHLGEAD
jgi:hypothetical protein